VSLSARRRKMSSPRVSVILPCWNASRHLARALASLAGQTFSDFEIVAVDDGSTDETPRLLAEWAEREGRIRVVRQEHGGLVAAPNAGLAAARGELIARMDADDIAHPRRLEWQVGLMDGRPEVAVAGGMVRIFPRAGMRSGMRRYEEWLNSTGRHEEMARDLFVENPLAHPSVMMRAAAVREAGGYRETGWAEDYDLTLRLYGCGARFEKVPRVVLWWRDREDRATRTQSEYSSAAFRQCKVEHVKQLHLGGRTRVAIWGAGKEGRALGKHVRRAGLEIMRFIDIAPTKIGRRLLGAEVEGPDGLREEEYLLVAVGARGARELIRGELAGRGWREPEDYRTMV
jgi:glycosyltransferase involved in cell wall biosynthesis